MGDPVWWTDLRGEQIGAGASPALIDELLELILTGKKTASTGALSAYNGVIPRAGDRCVLMDGRFAPRCVIEVDEVTVQRFDEVSEAFALLEGEGDYPAWRAAHERFFAEFAGGFSPDMTVVCERYRVIEIISEQG